MVQSILNSITIVSFMIGSKNRDYVCTKVWAIIKAIGLWFIIHKASSLPDATDYFVPKLNFSKILYNEQRYEKKKFRK